MNNHNLIKNTQDYLLNRKLLTIHSEDRDTNKWPDSNNFEVILPNTFKNVQSIRLVQISIPKTMPTFSINNKNIKMIVGLGNYDTTYEKDNEKTIIIPEGTYTGAELAIILETKLNESFNEKIFKVVYHTGFNKIMFFNKKQPFVLRFDKDFSDYSTPCEAKRVSVLQGMNTGLPINLGYKKQIYISQNLSDDDTFSKYVLEYNNMKILPNSKTNYWVDIEDPLVFFEKKIHKLSTLPKNIQKKYEIGLINLAVDKCVYMEIDKYNSMDEIKPYSLNTTASINNDYNGKTNAAFAKIPLFGGEFVQIYDSANSNIFNVSHYDPPIKSISKLKFKFRFHDGRLIDFKNLGLTFTLEINMLTNEQERMANVRVPQFYNLS